MVVYGLALGNQRQLNGGDFSTRTDELWPGGVRGAASVVPVLGAAGLWSSRDALICVDIGSILEARIEWHHLERRTHGKSGKTSIYMSQ
jgi:hypothetical protein